MCLPFSLSIFKTAAVRDRRFSSRNSSLQAVCDPSFARTYCGVLHGLVQDIHPVARRRQNLKLQNSRSGSGVSILQKLIKIIFPRSHVACLPRVGGDFFCPVCIRYSYQVGIFLPLFLFSAPHMFLMLSLFSPDSPPSDESENREMPGPESGRCPSASSSPAVCSRVLPLYQDRSVRHPACYT